MINKSPDRSPIAVVEAIKDIIKGKTICDIGCRNGDMVVEFSKYAKEAFGIEQDFDNVKVCIDRGLNVKHIKVDLDSYNIPKADVYYVWIGKDTNIRIANAIHEGIVIIGGDPSIGEVYELGGEKISVPYNEGEGVRQKGVFGLTILKKGD
jgi:hypothetical protein